MTVLQKIINELEVDAHKTGDDRLSVAEVVAVLKYELTAEEQQTRDAYSAGKKRQAWVYHGSGQPPAEPDLETYIKTLKQ